MSAAIWLSAAGCGILALLAWRVGGRSRILLLGIALVAAVTIAVILVHSLSRVPSNPRLLAEGLGRLAVSRVGLGVSVGALGALLLELLVGGDSGPSPAATAVALLLALPASLALATSGLIPLALLVLAVMVVLWARWQRVAGPQLPLRSLARQATVVFAVLLAAAAVLPSTREGSAPAVLEAILLAAGVTGFLGVLPFSGWVGSAVRVGRSEGGLWRIWVVPAAVVMGARVVAGCPHSVELPLQELLIGLGVASSIFWSARAATGGLDDRYWRVLAADAGFMCVGVGLGTAHGLEAALLLVLTHWLGGAVLGRESGARSQLLAWVGLSGVPPFGGFTGRILIVIAASQVSFTVAGLLLFAMGLQLAAGARGIRAAASAAADHLTLWRELLGLLVAAATLLLGLVPSQALGVVMGLHP